MQIRPIKQNDAAFIAGERYRWAGSRHARPIPNVVMSDQSSLANRGRAPWKYPSWLRIVQHRTRGARGLRLHLRSRANRTTEIDSLLDGVINFNYDSTNQLTDADDATQVDEDYEYNANGNRTGGAYDLDPNNQLATDGTYNYEYDAEGNLTAKETISSGERVQYTWDYRNRLTLITFRNDLGEVVKTVEQTYDVFNGWGKRSVDADGVGGCRGGGTVDTYFALETVKALRLNRLKALNQ